MPNIGASNAGKVNAPSKKKRANAPAKPSPPSTPRTESQFSRNIAIAKARSAQPGDRDSSDCRIDLYGERILWQAIITNVLLRQAGASCLYPLRSHPKQRFFSGAVREFRCHSPYRRKSLRIFHRRCSLDAEPFYPEQQCSSVP
jgi:hypothetical protein